MNNIFKNNIKNASNYSKSLYREMEDFSYKLQLAMKLTKDDIKEAEKEECIFKLINYQIASRSFPWNSWENILVATPLNVDGDKVGYSNMNESSQIDASWDIINKGTASIILPPKEIQQEIFLEIKAMIKNSRQCVSENSV